MPELVRERTVTDDGGESSSRERFWRRLGERTLIAFGVCCIVLVLIAPQDRQLVPGRLCMCLCPAAVLGVTAALLSLYPSSWILWAARYAACLVFLPFFFRLTGQIAPFLPLGYFDGGIMALDGLLFGNASISLRFQTTGPFASPYFGELMCSAYLAYYVFVPLYAGRLIVTRLRRTGRPSATLAWYTACCAIAYVLHYTFFFLFPVEGPAFHLEGGPVRHPGYAISELHHLIVARGDVPGGCFPSSHVSIALLHVFIAVHLGWRRIAVLAAAITAGVVFAIVYTKAHYATDAIGGLFSGVLLWYLFVWIERVYRRRAAREPCAEAARAGTL